MEWLVKHLRTYKLLRAECDQIREAYRSLETQSLLLQDRLDATLVDRSKLWDLTRECISSERLAFQMHINASWQKQGHGVPYPEAPQIPAHAVPQEQNTDPIARRAFPSEAMARQTSRFIDSLVTNEQ